MWTHASWDGAWWLLVFAAALVVIWSVPLRRRRAREPEQEGEVRSDHDNRAGRR